MAPRTSPASRWGSPDGRYAVALPEPVWLRISRLCHEAGSLETGGILVGSYDESLGLALIHQASGPPVDSKRGFFGFSRGRKGANEWLASLWKQGSYYLGEWHLHPAASPRPSATDLRALAQIARDPNYSCSSPLLLVVGGHQHARRQSWWVWTGKHALEMLPTGDSDPK